MSKKVDFLKIIDEKRKQGNMDKHRVDYFESEVLGGTVEIIKKPLAEFMSIVENEDDSATNLQTLNNMLFEFLPMFSDPEANKEAMEVYGVQVPTDLPSYVFEDNIGEMTKIVEKINNMYGLDEIEDDIKN